jgi:hypothetical protein
VPLTPPTANEHLWARLWPTNVSQELDLKQLVALLNRRFRGMPTPPIMTSAVSRSIWSDVDQNMKLPDLIRLINRRLGGIRIPMSEDALIVSDLDPVGSESILMAGQANQTFHIGGHVLFQAGGPHSQIWDATVKRYARRISGGGYVRANEELDPRSLIDPRYPNPGYRLRARECLAHTVTIPGGAASYSSWWGFGGMPNALAGADANYFPFVGFRVFYNKTAANVVTKTNAWHCTVVNDQCAALYDVQTAVDSSVPHEFQLVFESTTSTVVWLIDGIQVGSYTFLTNTAPGQVTPYPAGGGGTAAGAWNMLWAANLGGGVVTMAYLSHMSPATPLITLEFDDTAAA